MAALSLKTSNSILNTLITKSGLLKSVIGQNQYCLNCRQLRLPTSQHHEYHAAVTQRKVSLKHQRFSPYYSSLKYLTTHVTGSSKSQNNHHDIGMHFVESENEYFHSYLEALPDYQPYLLDSHLNKENSVLPSETVTQLLQELKDMKKVENLLTLLDHWTGIACKDGLRVLSDDSFSQTVRLLKRNVNRLSVEEAIECMVKLSKLGFRESILSYSEPRKNRILISKAFDQLCSKRIKKFNPEQLLLAADFFYSLRGSSFTDFPSLMCERMQFFLPKLSKEEKILLLFHAGMTRKTSGNLIAAILEQLKGDMHSLSLQELGIINLAHYKTRSHVSQPAYFSALAEKLKVEARGVDPICLSSVLKYQQKSLHKSKNQLLPEFFNTVRDMEEPLLPQISKLPSETLMHVLNLYFSLDLLSEELFMATIDRVVNTSLKDWRVKDLAKVTHVLTSIPLGSEKRMEAVAAILVELRRAARKKERQEHPECMLQTAVALTYCSVYPHWLAEELFSDALQRRFKESDIDFRRDLYHVSESILIEDGTYIGPLLWPENFPKLAKNKIYSKLLRTPEGRRMCGPFVKQVGRKRSSDSELYTRDWILLDIMDALIKARHAVLPLPTFLLSHFQSPDIEVRLWPPEQSLGEPVFNPIGQDNFDFVSEAVVLHASNAYQQVRCHDGKIVPLLRQYHSMRARQLRKLGAVVIEVPFFEYQNSDDKSQYLLNKFKEEEDKQLGSELD